MSDEVGSEGLGQPFLDKDELKRRLSIRYVCHHYGIVLNDAGRALCPWHQDDDPSFRTFVNEAGHERYHCFPCSDGGDVFDLIQRMEPGSITFPETISIAETLLGGMPETWQPQAQAPQRSVEEWSGDVTTARQTAAEAKNHGYLSIATQLVPTSGANAITDEELCQAVRLDIILRDVFGWGIDDEGNVLMPHWDRHGTLTGCKVRTRGTSPRRWSLQPSQFRDLYGAWIPRRHDAVMLTEGEKDMAYGYAAAQREDVKVDVYGLPAGAEDDVSPEWLELIAGAKIVFLAFDPDDAGLRATKSWLSALHALNFQDVRVCRLPRGQDLTEVRPNLRQLLTEAVPPRPLPTKIEITPHGFVVQQPTKNDEEATRKVTTWSMLPIARLTPGDTEERLQPGLEVALQVDGQARNDVITNDDLRAKANISKWATPRNLVWHGSDNDAAHLAEFMHAHSSILPEVFQTSRCGIHAAPDRYSYVSPTLVTPHGSIGQLPWKYVHTRGSDITHHVLLHPSNTAPFDLRLLETFLDLGDSQLTHPLLAWFVAACRRHEVRNFPLCYVGGPSGSGKSTISSLACRMFGSDINANLGQVTPFVLMTHLSATTTLPVFLDEYTRQSKHSSIEALQASIPVIYEGGTAERGQQDLNTMSFRLSSPIIIAGEQTFDLDREVQRMVMLRANRRKQVPAALEKLQEEPLEQFAMMLYTWLIARSRELPAFPTTAKDRPSYNQDVLRTGWATLHQFLEEMAMIGHAVPDIPKEIDLSYADVVEAEHENVYEQALESIVNAAGVDGYAVVWIDTQHRGTWVRFNEVPPLAAKALGGDFLPGGGQAIRQYFESKYEVLRERTLVGGFSANLPTRKTAFLIQDYFAADPAAEMGAPHE